jgi:glutamate synthase domain-containing protein 2
LELLHELLIIINFSARTATTESDSTCETDNDDSTQEQEPSAFTKVFDRKCFAALDHGTVSKQAISPEADLLHRIQTGSLL